MATAPRETHRVARRPYVLSAGRFAQDASRRRPRTHRRKVVRAGPAYRSLPHACVARLFTWRTVMIQQFLGVAAAAVREHGEAAISAWADEADDGDRLQRHSRFRSRNLVRDELEDIPIDARRVHFLDAISTGPGARIETGPFRRKTAG